MKKIPLTQGKFAIVDDEDYVWLMQWKWYALKNRNAFYAVRMTGKWPNQRKIWMHRLILGLKGDDKTQTDHTNHNGLDNRKTNIRPCTRSENQHNRQVICKKTSQYKGVSWDKKKKNWRSTIEHNHHGFHLGNYDNEADAAIAYDKKAKELFNEFACTNL